MAEARILTELDEAEQAPMRVCAEHGCPDLTASTYCDAHTKQRRKQSDKRRPSARQRGYDRRHETDRKAYLRLHPVCEDESGCIEPSTDLDHIDGNPFNREWSNYRALCHVHHSKRTATDQPGGWNA